MYAHELYEQNKPRVVVTYPGRFQPFHQGHAGVFAQLQKKFGIDNVFILTSNDQSSPKSPFNFSDKYQLMTAAGVPGDKIIQTTSMYSLPEGFDPRTTIFVTAVGSPDMDRLRPDTFLKKDKKDADGNVTKPAGSAGYYKTWGKDQTPLTADQHGYVVVIPEIHKNITIKGKEYDVSHGTECRNLWNIVRKDPKARQEFLSQLYKRPSQELAAIFDKIPQPVAEGSWKKPKFDTNTVVYDGAKAKGISTFSAGYHPDVETAWIEAIKSVEPGAGAAMIKLFEQWAKSRGAKIIRAEALQPSLNFWKKIGYAVAGNPSSKNRVPIEKHIGGQGVAEGAPIVVMPAPIDVRNPKKAPQPQRFMGDIVPPTKPPSTEKRGVKGRPGQRPMPKYDESVDEGSTGNILSRIKDTEELLSRHAQHYIDKERREGPLSGSDIFQRENIRKQLLTKKRKLQSQLNSMVEDAAGVGVIASKKQAKDPRYSMSLTNDVRPGQVNKSLKAFKLAEDSISEEDIMAIVKKFLPVAMKELRIKALPEIILQPYVEVHGGQATFGRFVDAGEKIYLGIADRHPVDILRTLAHELVHFKQYEDGELYDGAGETGSPIENEAHVVAGIIMRHFNKKYPDAIKSKPLELDK